MARPAGQLPRRDRRHCPADATPAIACGRRARRFGSARHLADLYDRYGVHRPGMLRAWAAKDDADGAGRPLPAQWAWQAELWRRLRDRIGVASPAERLDDACSALRGDAGIVALPARLSLFGLTRLPASYLAVLRALAAHRDVHLFLLHPSPVLWDRVAEQAGRQAAVVPRAADPTAGAAGQPAAHLLGPRRPGDAAGPDRRRRRATPAIRPTITTPSRRRKRRSCNGSRPTCGTTGHHRVCRWPGATTGPSSTRPTPASPSTPATAGAARSRWCATPILHLLAADPTLEPRDIIVMCPDIEAFAPLIHATFGAAEGLDGEATR